MSNQQSFSERNVPSFIIIYFSQAHRLLSDALSALFSFHQAHLNPPSSPQPVTLKSETALSQSKARLYRLCLNDS